ncbi:efflux RND transporter periplasmic adaptor subunit [Teichococcus aestuarii]|uniref:efflux RND transporter periplasmic adaptor subunit n=1 Tax=Teichococcus aestuarii TaxID=568898 RepID=UPI003619B988
MNAPVSPAAEAARATPAGPPPARRSRRRWLLRLLPLVVLAGAVLGGGWYWQVGRFLAETDDAYVQGDIVVLSPRIEAEVAEVLIADNQRVKAGEVLIRLDDRDARLQRDQAAAALAEAEAAVTTARETLAQLAAQVDASQAQIEQAAAERQSALAERERAESEQRRTAALAGSGWSSRQSAEQALAGQRKAEAALRPADDGRPAAEAELLVRQRAVPVQRAQLAQAEARREQARAALGLAENTLSYTELRAPFDGIAGNRAARLGQHVRPGQQLIAVSPLPETLYVTANFKETQLAGMRPGQPVELAVDALSGHALHGHVDSFAPATGSQFSLLPPENATGNFTKIVQRVPVKLVLEPGQDPALLARLRPGLSVVAEVDMRADPHAPRGLFSAAAATLGLK